MKDRNIILVVLVLCVGMNMVFHDLTTATNGDDAALRACQKKLKDTVEKLDSALEDKQNVLASRPSTNIEIPGVTSIRSENLNALLDELALLKNMAVQLSAAGTNSFFSFFSKKSPFLWNSAATQSTATPSTSGKRLHFLIFTVDQFE